MAKYRRGRINEEMVKEMASILREIKDPRVTDNFVSVTAADVTPDLKFAKIYFSAMTGDKKEIRKGLMSASGFIRKRLAETLNLRQTPELSFVADDSIEYGAHINELLGKLEYADIPEDEETDDE
ncbi:MAG: 30S ribosome-binding factor RbfA [Ruminococcaceae bacterium]|nr:30S ribosome-binding factor RbfA [Oscillospiraceae bacterium]